jgi:hypothetical protein
MQEVINTILLVLLHADTINKVIQVTDFSCSTSQYLPGGL